MNLCSFFREAVNPDFFGQFRGLSGRSNQRSTSVISRQCARDRIKRRYSAAAAKDGFAFADDSMKSEMRGTISDLKRDPLNTP